MFAMPSGVSFGIVTTPPPSEHDDLERYRAYFEASSNGIFVYDELGKLIDINPAACRMHGFTRAHMLAMDPREFIAPESHHVFEAFRAAVSKGEVYTGEAQGVRHDGTRFDVEVVGQMITIGERQHLFSSLIDVSQRKALAEQLQHAQRMEAVGQLAGGIAHDFNNLLSVILGYSELISARLSDESILKDLGCIVAAGDRARDLVQHLLAFSRRQTLAVQETDLNAWVEAQSDTLRRVLPESIRIEVGCCPMDAGVRIDRGQLEQVLLNLAINAQHAMPQGGTLQLEVARVDLDEDYARRHTEVRHGPHVTLLVSDDGEGMNAETQARIFEPFFTTKNHGQGTGLGLAMVYGILKQHGGHVSVYSEVGQGTTFKLYLPHVPGSTEAVTEDVSSPLQRGQERILIVEDSREVRDLTARVLLDLGYEVLSAPELQGALETTAGLDHLDLLLSDVILPGQNGRQVFEALRERFPDLRVLYMSGYTENVVSHQGLLDSGVRLIQKPFDLKQLASEVRRALDAPTG